MGHFGVSFENVVINISSYENIYCIDVRLATLLRNCRKFYRKQKKNCIDRTTNHLRNEISIFIKFSVKLFFVCPFLNNLETLLLKKMIIAHTMIFFIQWNICVLVQNSFLPRCKVTEDDRSRKIGVQSFR